MPAFRLPLEAMSRADHVEAWVFAALLGPQVWHAKVLDAEKNFLILKDLPFTSDCTRCRFRVASPAPLEGPWPNTHP